MAELRTLVEREMDLAGLPSYGFTDLARRRDRKQRNRRIAAGVVALALVALVIGGWLGALMFDRSTPADDPSRPIRFESPLYGYGIEIPGDWTATPANLEWEWGEALEEGSTDFYRRDDQLFASDGSITISAMAIPQDLTEQEWLDRIEDLRVPDNDYAACALETPLERIEVGGVVGNLATDCNGLVTVTFASQGRGYRMLISGDALSGDAFRQILATIELNPVPPSERPTSADAWRGIWPQSSSEEAEAAQAGANAGNADYTWQVDPDGAQARYLAGDAVAIRFLREQLGWEELHLASGGTTSGPGTSAVSEGVFIRCDPDGTNVAYPTQACAPEDGNRFETVLIRWGRLTDPGRQGIWSVTRWEELPPFEQAVPPTEQEVRELIEDFAEARIAGEGAQAYLLKDWGPVQLLHATSEGEPYESFEIVDVTSPTWPGGEVVVTLRMIASGGSVVVEQTLAVFQRGPTYPFLEEGLWIEGRLTATENGEPVAVRYGILGGRVTFDAVEPWYSPWAQGVVDGDETILSKADEGMLGGQEAYLTVLDDPWLPRRPECSGSPASADELVRWIVESPELEASAPETVTVGGVEAVRLDVAAAPGAEICSGESTTKGVPIVIAHGASGADHPFGVQYDERMRIYLLELPEEPGRTIAIMVVATTDAFERVLEAAAPIVESIRFAES